MGITAKVVANPTASMSFNYTADVVVDDPALQCQSTLFDARLFENRYFQATVGLESFTSFTPIDHMSGQAGDRTGVTYCRDRQFTNPSTSLYSVSFSKAYSIDDPLKRTGNYLHITPQTAYNTNYMTTTDIYVDVSLSFYPQIAAETQYFGVVIGAACEKAVMQQLPYSLTSDFTQINTFENLTFLQEYVGSMFYRNFHDNICRPSLELLQKKNGAANWESLDPTTFFPTIATADSIDLLTVQVHATSPSARGTYELGYTVTIPNEPVTPQTFTSQVNLEIIDYCTLVGLVDKNVATFVNPPKFYFSGNLFAPDSGFDASAIFSSTNATYCPLTFSCERYDLVTNDPISCNFDDGQNTQVTFDESNGKLSFHSTDRDNVGYTSGEYYQLTITAYADIDKTNFQQIQLGLDIACLINKEEFIWIEPIEQDAIEYTRKDYLGLPWPTLLIEPWAASQPAPVYSSSTGCSPEPPFEWNILDEAFTSQGENQTPTTNILDPNDVSVAYQDLQPESTQNVTFVMSYKNIIFETADLTVIPQITRSVTFLDGYLFLEVSEFRQLSLELDLAQQNVLNFESPLFQDDSRSDIHFLSPDFPERNITFQVKGKESLNFEQFLNITVLDNTMQNLTQVEFLKTASNLFDELQVITCFSYGEVYQVYENLQNLCDNQQTHQITNSKGYCFDQLEQLQLASPILETTQIVLFEQSKDVMDLAMLDIPQDELSPECGQLGFKLVDPNMSSLVQLTESGLISTQSVQDSSWLGQNDLAIEFYLKDIDTDHLWTKQLDLTLSVQVFANELDSVKFVVNSLIKEKPESVGKLSSTYKAYYGETTSFTFNFVDPLVLKDPDELPIEVYEPQRLQISVIENELPAIIYKESRSDNSSPGYGSIQLNVDGIVAEAYFGGQKEDTENTSASSEQTNHLKVTLKAKDIDIGGLDSTFEIVFEFSHNDSESDEEDQQDDTSDDQASQLTQEQQDQIAKMTQLLTAALSHQSQFSGFEDIPVKAELKNIDVNGNTFIKFDPAIVSVPNDWQALWDIKEREKLSLKDREAFERELLRIMHVQFELNSEEQPQKYLYPDLLEFTQSGIQIQVNFSDPLLVSQGQIADKISIKLLKSYFMVPSPILASLQGLTRSLATFEENEEYIIVKESIPKQVKSWADLIQLQGTAALVESVMQSGFALTFTMNLLLHGVMSQLWNVFNTLQVILALPMLAVVMPANIAFMQSILKQIVYFSIVDNVQVQESIVEPLFGKKESQDDPSEDIQETTKDEVSLLAQTFQIFAAIVVLSLLIGLLVFCSIKIVPKCCPCFKKVIATIKAKLMFNSILRSLIQTYLLTTIQMWSSFLTIDLEYGSGIADLIQAIIFLIALAAYPLWICVFLRKNQERLPDADFKAKYDSTYQNVEIYNRKALLHTSFFLGRRLLFAAVIVFGQQSIVLQVMLADVLSTLLLAFFFSVKPMTNSVNNTIQIINECFVLVCIWLMFWFTLFVPDAELRYELADHVMKFLGVNICINVAVLLFTVVQKVYRACKSCYLKRKTKAIAKSRVHQDQEEPSQKAIVAAEKIGNRRKAISQFVELQQQNINLNRIPLSKSSSEFESESASSSSAVSSSSVSKSNVSSSSASQIEEMKQVTLAKNSEILSIVRDNEPRIRIQNSELVMKETADPTAMNIPIRIPMRIQKPKDSGLIDQEPSPGLDFDLGEKTLPMRDNKQHFFFHSPNSSDSFFGSKDVAIGQDEALKYQAKAKDVSQKSEISIGQMIDELDFSEKSEKPSEKPNITTGIPGRGFGDDFDKYVEEVLKKDQDLKEVLQSVTSQSDQSGKYSSSRSSGSSESSSSPGTSSAQQSSVSNSSSSQSQSKESSSSISKSQTDSSELPSHYTSSYVSSSKSSSQRH